jgi:glutamine cyclotransferase
MSTDPSTGRGGLSVKPVARPLAPVLAVVAIVLAFLSGAPARSAAPVYGYEVRHVYPHDTTSFTEGLIYKDGFLYEGTGWWGQSCLRKVELATGLPLKQHDLPAEDFGEGVTALRDTLFQITWGNHRGYRYAEQDTFQLLETFPYPFEGWGLTHDGVNLITSDGSATIRFLDPRTRQVLRQVQVRDDLVAVNYLNELEYIHGRIYANVLPSDRIAVIDPGTGRVDAWLDLGGLRDSVAGYPVDVLNGIAHDPATDRLWVTGKYWPKLFEIAVPTLPTSGTPGAGPGSPDQGQVLPNFPSPISRPARMQFTLPAPAAVTLRLYDIRGRLVRTLVEGTREAGRHEFDVDPTTLPSGAYVVVFRAGTRSESRKLVIVK